MTDVKPYKQVSKVQGIPLCHFDRRHEVLTEKSKKKYKGRKEKKYEGRTGKAKG